MLIYSFFLELIKFVEKLNVVGERDKGVYLFLVLGIKQMCYILKCLSLRKYLVQGEKIDVSIEYYKVEVLLK